MLDEQKKKEAEERAVSFMDHLRELRSRLIKCVYALALGFSVAYYFSPQLMYFVMWPLKSSLPPGSSVTMLNVTEGFMAHMKIALMLGVVFALPPMFYQIWRFVAPALYQKERKQIIPFVLAATFFFLCGASFCYFAVLPWGLKFFFEYATPEMAGGAPMDASISIEEYINFFVKFIISFGLVFELPVITYFFARIGVVNHRMLSKARGLAVVIIFIVAAVMTPPDVMSQLLMAAPLCVLYEISIIVARIFGPKVEEEKPEEENV